MMKKRLISMLLCALLLATLLPMAAQAVTNQGTVVGGWLRLRQSPSLNASILTSYPTGTVLTITGSTGDWYQVTGPDSLKGYVMAAYVNVSGGSSYNAYVTSQNGKGVRLRSGPSTTYRVYAVYPVGTPVTVLQHGAYWDYIRVGYRTGYMMNEFLTTGSTPSGEGYYAFVTSSNGYGVRLRARPSQSASIYGVYSVGTRVYVITHDTYWDYIRVGTREGYMMNKFLIRSSDSGVTGVTVSPATATVAKGSAYDFSAIVSGTAVSQDVQWTISGTGLSAATSISSTGHLFVAADETATSITVKATSIANSNFSGTAKVTVSGTVPVITSVSVTAAGNASAVSKGATLQFSATVNGTGTPSQEVTWTVMGAKATGTSVSAAGLLTVAADETASSLNVIATAKGNSAVSGSKNVTVTEPATVTSVTVSSASDDVAKGSTVQLSATVTGTNNPAQTVTWSVTGNSSADTKVSSTGLLTVASDETAASLTVQATSTVDTTKSGTKAVTVKAAVATVTSVTVSGADSIALNTTETYTAAVVGTNSPAQTVTWEVSGNAKAGTTISAAGVLTVAADETATSLTVKAISTVDTSKNGTKSVTVLQPTVTSVTVSGADSVGKGAMETYTAAVAGTNSPAQTVTWEVSGNAKTGTTISAVGVLTVAADETATSLTVKAISTVDTSKSGTKSVTVNVAPTTYTITYKPGANGTGSDTPATKTHGTPLTLAGATFTRSGYTQTGWTTTDGGAKEYELSGSYIAEAAADLYPVWTADTYTITYKPGTNGTGSETSTDKTHGTSLTLAGATFTRSGYTQTGWTTTDGGAKEYELSGSYTAEAAADLYPVWTVEP